MERLGAKAGIQLRSIWPVRIDNRNLHIFFHEERDDNANDRASNDDEDAKYGFSIDVRPDKANDSNKKKQGCSIAVFDPLASWNSGAVDAWKELTTRAEIVNDRFAHTKNVHC